MPFDRDLAAVAERFVRFVHDETAMPVIVCDETGTIAHATVRARVSSIADKASSATRPRRFSTSTSCSRGVR